MRQKKPGKFHSNSAKGRGGLLFYVVSLEIGGICLSDLEIIDNYLKLDISNGKMNDSSLVVSVPSVVAIIDL